MSSFIAAAKNFFGFLPEQKLGEFKAEIDALTHEDKLELAAGMRANGIDCDDPAPKN